MDVIHGPLALREIDERNRAEIEALRVSDEQSRYVADNAASLVEAALTPDACPWYRGVYVGDVAVGFVMISDNIPRDRTQYLGPYYLWRLMIDERFQGRGYGRQTLDLVVQHVLEDPGATELLSSIVPGEVASPRGFYLRYGFRLRGDVVDGEEVTVLPLRP